MNGVYILVLNINKDLQEKIGPLGKIKFDKGNYVYVGSAQNSIEKRVARHKSKNKKLFWHIDYLLNNKAVKILKIFYKKAEKQEECKIAGKINETAIPIPNFGCSDCKCISHLYKIEKLNIVELKMKKL